MPSNLPSILSTFFRDDQRTNYVINNISSIQMMNASDLLNCLKTYFRDDERNRFTYNVRNKIHSINGDELLKCLGAFFRDDERNKFTKYIVNKVSSMNGNEVVKCLGAFFSDDYRNYFMSHIEHKINSMNGNEVAMCLKKYFHDDDKDVFLNTMWNKIFIDVEGISKISSCFLHGSKNLTNLIVDKKITVLTTDTKLSVCSFLKNIKSIDDNDKYRLLQRMKDNLEIENVNIEGICEYFNDVDILRRTFILFGVDSNLIDNYIKKYGDAMNDFWIYDYKDSSEKNGVMYDNFTGTKIDISQGINYSKTDKYGTLTIKGYNGSYSIKIVNGNSSSSTSGIDIRKKKLYCKEGFCTLYDSDNNKCGTFGVTETCVF